MTPEQLETVIIDGTVQDLVAVFKGMPESDRRKLSKTAQSIQRFIEKSRWGDVPEPGKTVSARVHNAMLAARKQSVVQTAFRVGYAAPQWLNQCANRAELSVLAAGPLSAVKRLVPIHYSETKPMVDILLDRRPEWLGEWVQHRLEQKWGLVPLNVVQQLIEAGAMETPQSDAYITHYANSLMSGYYYPQITEELTRKPYLLADAHRIFTVESNAFNTNGWLTKGAGERHESWPEAMLKMIDDGTLDREFILSEALRGMGMELKSNQLSGIAKFYKSAKPTAAERLAHRDAYRGLLSSPVGTVARFALDQYATLHKAKALSGADVLADVPAIFSQSSKSHPVAAIKLIARVSQSEPDRADAVATALIPALSHENADVQETALGVLESIAERLSAEACEAVAGSRAFISPHLAGRLAALRGSQGQGASEAASDAASGDISEKETIDAGAVAALSSADRAAWGFDRMLAGMPYAPITDDILQLRVLHVSEPYHRIADQDELLSAVASFIEMPQDLTEAERIADGIARIPRLEDADFHARVEPIQHRLRSESNYYQPTPGGENMADLIRSWLDTAYMPNPKRRGDHYAKAMRDDETSPMQAHYDTLRAAVVAGQTPGRLCTPTHEGGWIDPRLWVARLSRVAGRLDPIDLCYSLLRLAPDYRDEAASQLGNVPDVLRPLAAFVLGATDAPPISPKAKLEVWMSAARARDPEADWSSLFREFNIVEFPPGAVAPWNEGWSVDPVTLKHRPIDFTFHTTPAVPGTPRRLRRKAALEPAHLPTHRFGSTWMSRRWSYQNNNPGRVAWYATLFPLRPHMMYRSAIRSMTFRIDDTSNSFEPVHGGMAALFVKNRPWSEMARLTVALALFGRDADALGLVVDALVEGTESGQVDPARLGATLHQLSTASGVKLNRPGAPLLQVAQVSALQAHVVGEIFAAWLPGLDRKRRGLADLLGAALQSYALAGTALPDAMRDWLEGFSGSSKAAKTARSLLALQEKGSAAESVRASAINARLSFV